MFALHPQLAADCIVLGQGELSLLLLMNDARYPWFILVPQRADVRELHHLADEDRGALQRESDSLARIITEHFQPATLNIAKLGNVVPQLHLHHIARFAGDAAWPGPVWGRPPAQAYAPEALAELRSRLAPRLQGHFD